MQQQQQQQPRGLRRWTPRAIAFVVAVMLVCAAAMTTTVMGDLYMHNPRGSNNRLNENTATRTTNNRMFNSQNNARGGYNVGDRGTDAFDTNPANSAAKLPAQSLAKMYDASIRDMDRGTNNPTANVPYPMVYYEGSILPIEWTLQHGCGGNEANDPSKTNCDVIFQYMCETGYGNANAIRGAEELRDGFNTGQPDTVNAYTLLPTAADGAQNRNNGRGRQESEQYYYECTQRSRNQGLFTADQNLNGNKATATRQNPNNGRSGLECPEERDYYPYWNPSPWKDIAIMTDHPEINCNADGTYNGASQNNVPVGGCFPAAGVTDQNTINNALSKITQATCAATTGAQWRTFTHNLPAPACMAAPYSRTNHLGNGENGTTLTYSWSLPTMTTFAATNVATTASGGQNFAKCVLRMRYNISTDDYNPYTTDSTKNGNNSPVRNDPTVDIGSTVSTVTLDIDTAQTGRVFQDRSHTFYVASRPAAFATQTIYNLNIRGKRGNIVQTYPAVEYDFVPHTSNIKSTDLVHIQWTGSNTHNNGGGGGDGQAGDDGQGATGTDRNNFAQMLAYGDNYPMPYDRFADNVFSRSTCYMLNGTVWGPNAADTTPDGQMGPRATDCAVAMWSSGYFLNRADYLAQTGKQVDINMNTSPATLVGGMIFSIRATAVNTTYPFMSSRNNAFTNRAQKGFLIVSP